MNLSNLPDEEFSILVTRNVPRAVMKVTVKEDGYVSLNSGVAKKLAKIPYRFDLTKIVRQFRLLQ